MRKYIEMYLDCPEERSEEEITAVRRLPACLTSGDHQGRQAGCLRTSFLNGPQKSLSDRKIKVKKLGAT
jgi:hypothetical protein